MLFLCINILSLDFVFFCFFCVLVLHYARIGLLFFVNVKTIGSIKACDMTYMSEEGLTMSKVVAK